MKKFIIKLFIALILFISILFTITTILSLQVEMKGFNNYETENNLFFIKKNEKFDLMFMGISHARNFSRYMNHNRVEKKLNKKIINIGRGGGACGAAAQHTYLKHFYGRGNKVDKIVYILSPPMMFSEYLDRNSNMLANEPFRVDFFFQYLLSKGKNRTEQLYYYVYNKYTSKWKKNSPRSAKSKDSKLKSISEKAIENGFKAAYPKKLDSITYNRNRRIVENTIKKSINNNTKIIFLITPAVFGKWPGHNQVISFLEEMQSKYQIDFYDFSENMKDINLYYDHHHFNTKGVEYFTEKYLKKIVETE